MPINFTQIFQDSFNFLRNQRQLSLYFILAFLAVLIIMQLIMTSIVPGVAEEIKQQVVNGNITFPAEMQSQMSTDQLQELALSLAMMTHPTMISLTVMSNVAISFISTWGILTIHHINLRSGYSFGQTLGLALRYFLIALLINVAIFIPLIYGILMVLMGQFLGLPLLITGVYLFVRLCLTYLAYLVDNKSFVESFKTIWRASSKRFGVLFLFCLLNYLLFSLLNVQISAFSNINLVMEIVGMLLTALIHLFSMIFSYRFYTFFMNK